MRYQEGITRRRTVAQAHIFFSNLDSATRATGVLRTSATRFYARGNNCRRRLFCCTPFTVGEKISVFVHLFFLRQAGSYFFFV